MASILLIKTNLEPRHELDIDPSKASMMLGLQSGYDLIEFKLVINNHII